MAVSGISSNRSSQGIDSPGRWVQGTPAENRFAHLLSSLQPHGRERAPGSSSDAPPSPPSPRAFGSGLLSLPGTAPPAPSIDIADVRQQVETLRESLGGAAEELFDEHGIDTSQPIVLQSDGTGRMRVVNDHPDKDLIEQLLTENADLANMFHQLSANARLLRALEEVNGAEQAGLRNFGQLASTSAHLLRGSDALTFNLTLTDGEAETAFV